MTAPISRRSAFTLIELLLVLVIIGVLTAVSVPSFVRSMKGNRLKTAARTVAAAGRYARSMAVLHQRPVAVTFQIDGHDLVVDLARKAPTTDDEEDAEPPDRPLGPAMGFEDDIPETPSSVGSGSDPAIRIERTLDGVLIQGVDMTSGALFALEEIGEENRIRVIYGTNGRVSPHEIRLQDEDGTEFIVVVDVLGSPEIVGQVE